MRPPSRDLIRCPVHNIPDCSPLLNGCNIPDRLATAYTAGYRSALRDASTRAIEAVNELYDAEPSDPSPPRPDRRCRCRMTALNRESPSCPACRDHIDLPVIAER